MLTLAGSSAAPCCRTSTKQLFCLDVHLQPTTKKEYHFSDLSTLADILSNSKGIISIDMAGRTVAADSAQATPNLTVKPGSSVRLSNGGLALPPGCVLGVGPVAALHLVNMDISGQGASDCGLVTIKGAGATASLQKCQVSCSSRGQGSSDAVLVADGGKAALQDCFLTAAAGDGLSVKGAGSSATANSCVAHRNNGSGFAVRMGGLLSAALCTASNNKGAGFLATGAGSRLEAGPACRAFGNGAQGFNAEDKAKLTCGRGCTATGNAGSGFRAHGTGSLLEAGPQCRAEGSGNNGFFAMEGGKLVAGEGCIAKGSIWAGFNAKEGASELAAGPGCQSICNSAQGFNVAGGAKLTAGEGCVAR
jgi:hypothetical protein